jgi:virginiamycin B lyase
MTSGSKPRFLTVGGGSIWTLNQGDGSASRVDEKSRKLVATIQLGTPGTGGDIGYGADSVWSSVFEVPRNFRGTDLLHDAQLSDG